MKNYSYLVNRHFKVNKKRKVLTIIGIISSMILFFTIGYINNYVNDSYTMKSIENGGNYQVIISEVDKKTIDKMKNNIKVDKCGIYQYEGQDEILRKNNKEYLEAYKLDKVLIENIYKGLTSVTEGRLPKNEKEITLPYLAKKNLNISNHSEISINNKNYKVVGFYKDKHDFFGNRYTGITGMDKIDDKELVNIVVRVKEKYGNVEDLKEIIIDSGLDYNKLHSEGKIQFNNAFIDHNELDEYRRDIPINEEAIILFALNLVVLVLTVILTYGSINISLNERKKQFATLRCIGATPSKIKSLLIKESILLGLYSIIPGIVIAQITSWFITYTLVNKSMNINLSQLNFKIYIDVIISTILLIAINIFFATIIPVVRVGKLSPIEVLRNKTKENKTIVSKKSKTIRKLFGYSGELAYKNIRANKKSFTITITTLSIILIALGGFSGYNYFDTKYYDERIKYSSDLNIRYDPISTDIYENITLSELVDYRERFVEGIRDLDIHDKLDYDIRLRTSVIVKENNFNKDLLKNVHFETIKNKNESYIRLDEVNLLILDNEYFKEVLANVNTNTKEVDKINNNDFLIVSNRKYPPTLKNNNINMYFNDSSSSNIPKVPIAMNFLGTIESKKLKGSGGYNYIHDLTMIVPEGFCSQVRDKLSVNLGSTINVSMKLDKAQNYEKSVELIKEYTSEYSAYFNEEMLNEVESKENISAFYIIVYIGLALIILISAINLINTRSIDIKLREKEFRVLLAIGMKKSSLRKMIFLEGIIAWFISTLIGGSVSIVILIVIKTIYSLEYKLHDINMPYITVIIGIIIILIISILTSSIPYRKFKNIDINDLMKEDE